MGQATKLFARRLNGEMEFILDRPGAAYLWFQVSATGKVEDYQFRERTEFQVPVDSREIPLERDQLLEFEVFYTRFQAIQYQRSELETHERELKSELKEFLKTLKCSETL